MYINITITPTDIPLIPNQPKISLYCINIDDTPPKFNPPTSAEVNENSNSTQRVNIEDESRIELHFEWD